METKFDNICSKLFNIILWTGLILPVLALIPVVIAVAVGLN